MYLRQPTASTTAIFCREGTWPSVHAPVGGQECRTSCPAPAPLALNTRQKRVTVLVHRAALCDPDYNWINKWI